MKKFSAIGIAAVASLVTTAGIFFLSRNGFNEGGASDSGALGFFLALPAIYFIGRLNLHHHHRHIGEGTLQFILQGAVFLQFLVIYWIIIRLIRLARR